MHQLKGFVRAFTYIGLLLFWGKGLIQAVACPGEAPTTSPAEADPAAEATGGPTAKKEKDPAVLFAGPSKSALEKELSR